MVVHLDWLGVSRFDARAGLVTGLLGLATLITVLGGRVVPAFTRNAMRRAGIESGLPRSHALLDMAGILASVGLALGWGLGVTPDWTAPAALAAGALQAARLAGWRSAAITHDPLLWSLHLGFGMLALGYLLLGLAGFGVGSETGAIHVLGIGAVGGMTLAIMTRASLGHTGRPLLAPRALVPAFLALPVAAGLRWAAAETGGGVALTLSLAAALLWIAAFALFLRVAWPWLGAEGRRSRA